MKKMKLAHIVSVAHLEQTRDNHYHMCLAHLVLQSPTYAAFYARMVAEGKYVLMDNGAAEGEQLPLEGLLEAYERIHPTEMILPDTLYDGKDTVKRTLEGLDYFQGKMLRGMKYMAVPQGKSFAEWAESAAALLQERDIDSIGVSKFLNTTTTNKSIRYEAVRFLDIAMSTMDKPKEIHLLGAHIGPGEVKEASDGSKHVRGGDTALAYLFSQAEKPLMSTSLRPHEEEIDFLDGKVLSRRLDKTMRRFEKVVGAKNTESESWK